MNGQIVDYSALTNSGLIAGDDGNGYEFAGAAWKDRTVPKRGMRVDFEAQGGDAVAVYRAKSASVASRIGGALKGVMGSEKTKVVAVLLAIFLGWAGVHKFYLGIKKPAVIQLAVAAVGGGLLLAVVVSCTFIDYRKSSLAGVLMLLVSAVGCCTLKAACVVGFVEGMNYWYKSDEDFQSIYVTGKKEWF